MRVQTKFFLVFILAIFAISLIFSQKTNPDNPLLFGLKRIQEKAFLALKFSPKQKVEYMSSLLDARLKELSEPVMKGNHNFVLASALRYSTLAGQMTDLIIANNLKEYVEPIKQKFMAHKKILYDLYVFYPKNVFEDEEYKYIEDDINYLKIYLDKLSSLK